ncbi:MAG: hypothetical protein NWE89_04195 [Candidatus Bathyarchaeota archaeon]|nr:hypothetical protein [Candidatus Bathyarchaeota archaeon]
MMTNQVSQEMVNNHPHIHSTSSTEIQGKIQELTRSVSEVYKYELLTTNQYLKQMELVLDIFNELSEVLAN